MAAVYQLTSISSLPALKPNPKASYGSMVRRILADRTGASTLKDLEFLDARSAADPAAARAMKALDAHHSVREYAPGVSDVRTTVKSLEASCPQTQRSCWRELIQTHGRRLTLPLLQRCESGIGGRTLGLPKRFGRVLANAGQGSIDRLEDWNSLLDSNVRRRLHQGDSDPRIEEYRSLYLAYQEARNGSHRGKISEGALYMDMKALEHALLPDQVRVARDEVKDRLLASGGREGLHSQSKVRKLLGSMASLPSHSRETFLFKELASVAISDPRELSYYSRMIMEELRQGPSRVQARLLPKFERALASVRKIYLDDQWSEQAVESGKLDNLLSGMAHRRPQHGSEGDEALEYFRSKLTVNGYVRNYTYL